jgi:hypothetical protein
VQLSTQETEAAVAVMASRADAERLRGELEAARTDAEDMRRRLRVAGLHTSDAEAAAAAAAAAAEAEEAATAGPSRRTGFPPMLHFGFRKKSKSGEPMSAAGVQ